MSTQLRLASHSDLLQFDKRVRQLINVILLLIGRTVQSFRVFVLGLVLFPGGLAGSTFRAIGPDLAGLRVPGSLQDPILELRDAAGTLLASNDDWRSDQEQEIIATGLAPQDNRDSVVLTTLFPTSYTAIVRGKNGTSGVALVEIYGLD